MNALGRSVIQLNERQVLAWMDVTKFTDTQVRSISAPSIAEIA